MSNVKEISTLDAIGFIGGILTIVAGIYSDDWKLSMFGVLICFGALISIINESG